MSDSSASTPKVWRIICVLALGIAAGQPMRADRRPARRRAWLRARGAEAVDFAANCLGLSTAMFQFETPEVRFGTMRPAATPFARSGASAVPVRRPLRPAVAPRRGWHAPCCAAQERAARARNDT